MSNTISRLCGVVAIAALVPAFAFAQVPDYEGEFFTDLTGKVPTRQKVEISKTLRVAGESSRIHPMLVAINRMSDYPALPQDINGFASKLATDWKIGEATTHKGILALFSIGDRKFFVAKTTNVEKSVTDAIASGFAGRTTEALRSGDIAHAMRMAAESIATSLPAAASASTAQPGAPGKTHTITRTTTEHRQHGGYAPGGYSQGSSSGSGLGIIGTVILIVLGFTLLGGLFTGGGGYGRPYGGYSSYGGGSGPGFWSGMFTGGLLGWMFGGHGWGNSWGGGGWGGGGNAGGGDYTDTTTTESWTDSGAGGGGDAGGGFDSFGGGSFDGDGSGGSW